MTIRVLRRRYWLMRRLVGTSDLLMFRAVAPGLPPAAADESSGGSSVFVGSVGAHIDDVIASAPGAMAALVRARARMGHCLACLRGTDGTVFSSGWVTVGPAVVPFEAGLRLAVPAGVTYLWDYVTEPNWRGRGMYRKLLMGVIKHDPPGRAIVIYCAAANTASRRGILAAGFRLCGTVRIQRWGALRRFTAGGRSWWSVAGTVDLDRLRARSLEAEGRKA